MITQFASKTTPSDEEVLFLILCARNTCDNLYEKKRHNQKYCSDSCCRIATNEKIMNRYYKKKDREAGVIRFCGICEVTKLSRYNEKDICAACEKKKETSSNDSALQMIMNASFA